MASDPIVCGTNDYPHQWTEGDHYEVYCAICGEADDEY